MTRSHNVSTRSRLFATLATFGVLTTLAISTGPAQAAPVTSDARAMAAPARVDTANKPAILVIDEKGTAKAVSASTLSASSSTYNAAAAFPRNGYGSAVGRISSTKRFDVTVDGRSSSVRRTDLTKVAAIQFAGSNLVQTNVADRVEMRVYVNGVFKKGTGVKTVGRNISQIQWNPPGIYNDTTGKGIEVWTNYRNRSNGKWYKTTAVFFS